MMMLWMELALLMMVLAVVAPWTTSEWTLHAVDVVTIWDPGARSRVVVVDVAIVLVVVIVAVEVIVL